MSHNLNKLVHLLNDGRFHDGDSLGEALHVTRSAIWKMINKLIDYGMHIESVKGKGYRLEEPIILLDSTLIEQASEDAIVEIFESIPSTHTYLKPYLGHPQKRICLAEQQTQGKGRLGRTWSSPFGQNIYFSYLHYFNIDLSQLASLSLVVCLAINRTLSDYTHPQMTHVKWPNDILFDFKKLAGILIEVQAEHNARCSTIISTGINVNMLNQDDTITQPWISLRKITGQYIDRNKLCINLLKNLNDYLKRFESEGFNHFIAEWNQHDFLKDQKIKIQTLNTITEGTVVGINERGELLLKKDNGDIQRCSSGDTTILKE